MDAREVTLAMLGSQREHCVVGRKRLHKLAHLMQVYGTDIESTFKIDRFGPYSREVANTVDFLVNFGEIEEQIEPTGIYSTIQYTYSLKTSVDTLPSLRSDEEDVFRKIDKYSTVALEVASTIAFYMSEGEELDTALDRTKEMKPTKTTLSVIEDSKEILKIVGAIK